MNGPKELYDILQKLNINFQYVEHPEAPTVEIARQYWAGYDASHCKNLFFRNHKGNRHYLVILHCDSTMDIRSLEKRLGQGKLSFASPERLEKYLGVMPGSVSPFGLIYDSENHTEVFIDKSLQQAERLSFHPCINTASLIVSKNDFLHFMNYAGNTYHWLDLIN
jgi:Ala-tRNA(Pro) deacylase